jgi:hypothetical protein
MDDLFRSYWWLLFPLGFFVFGAWDRWLVYKRSQDHLELIKAYAAQGKEPPPELVRGIRETVLDDTDDDYAGSRRGRRYYRRYHRYGPYWQWRAFFFTGAVALGFWLASEYADLPGTEGPFRLVAIIMTCVAGANLLGAILWTSTRGR